VGYKVALCERDIAIYLAIWHSASFLASQVAASNPCIGCSGLLLGIGPIGLDGFSQLFSQFNWEWLSALVFHIAKARPSCARSQAQLFGLFTAWFAYPNIEESMSETRQYYIKKFAVNQASE
jgi:hypothetical protein